MVDLFITNLTTKRYSSMGTRSYCRESCYSAIGRMEEGYVNAWFALLRAWRKVETEVERDSKSDMTECDSSMTGRTWFVSAYSKSTGRPELGSPVRRSELHIAVVGGKVRPIKWEGGSLKEQCLHQLWVSTFNFLLFYSSGYQFHLVERGLIRQHGG